MTSGTSIQELHAGISRKDWTAVEIASNRLRDELTETRRILAGTAIGSLPHDYPLSHLAEDALRPGHEYRRALMKIEIAGLGGFLTPDLCAEIVTDALSKATA